MPTTASDPYPLAVGTLTDDGLHAVKEIAPQKFWAPIRPNTETGLQNLAVHRSLTVADATDSQALVPFANSALRAWFETGTDMRLVETLSLPITNNDARAVQVSLSHSVVHAAKAIRPETKIKQVFEPVAPHDRDSLGWTENAFVFDGIDASSVRDYAYPVAQQSVTRITLNPGESTVFSVERKLQVERFANGPGSPIQELSGFDWWLSVAAVSGKLI